MNKQTNIKTKLMSVSISALLVFILQIGLVKGRIMILTWELSRYPLRLKKVQVHFITQLTTIRADKPTDKAILYLKY